MSQKLKKEVILNKIDTVTRSNMEAEMLISYYQSVIEKSTDKELKAQTQLKVDQMKAACAFNDGFLEHIAHLLADLD